MYGYFCLNLKFYDNMQHSSCKCKILLILNRAWSGIFILGLAIKNLNIIKLEENDFTKDYY